METTVAVEQTPGVLEQSTAQVVRAGLFNGKRHSFSPEKARQAALKRHELERQRIAQSQVTPQTNSTEQPPQQKNTFVSEQLAQVRAEMVRLQGLASKLKEPLDIERMNRAIGTLAERERILAGRPLPGSHRPTSRRSKRNSDLDSV